jgi:hypothetical protein
VFAKLALCRMNIYTYNYDSARAETRGQTGRGQRVELF